MTDDLIHHESHGLTLSIRRRYEQAETMIVREVQTAYAWDFPITAALDLGAHIGAWTREAKRRHPAARIAAVEAAPDNFALLAHNIRGIEGITALQAVCGYGAGAVVIGQHRYNSGSHRVYRTDETAAVLAANPNWAFVAAPPRLSPEQILAQVGLASIDTLKIDCEGCEIDIFTHVSDAFLAPIQHIIGEIHTLPADFEAATNARLQRAGFQIAYTPHPANPQYSTLHAWRPPDAP